MINLNQLHMIWTLLISPIGVTRFYGGEVRPLARGLF